MHLEPVPAYEAVENTYVRRAVQDLKRREDGTYDPDAPTRILGTFQEVVARGVALGRLVKVSESQPDKPIDTPGGCS